MSKLRSIDGAHNKIKSDMKFYSNIDSSIIKKFLDFLYSKTYLTLAILFVVGLAIVLVPLGQLSKNIVEINALESAKLYADAITEFRTIYTSEVIDRIADSTYVGHDYLSVDNGIPLPATLSMLLGKRIGDNTNGGSTKLYSPYPFPWRKETGGLRTDFQKNAWNAFQLDKKKPYYEFTSVDGMRLLRYAQADLLRPSCVSCHNTHPQTPKTGWKVGDVRGVLEVSIPLDNISKASSTGVSTTFLYSLLMTIMILTILGLAIRRLKTANLRIEAYADKRELSAQEVLNIVDEEKRKIATHLHDHIGQILTSAKLNFEEVATRIERNSGNDKLTENLHQLLNEAYDVVKELSYSIVPDKLLNQGLRKAIEDFTARLEIITPIKFRLYFKTDETKMDTGIKASIFGIIQEATNNIIKYSLAKNVLIQIIDSDTETTITIEDDGIGFEIADRLFLNEKGLGLRNMKSRAEWLNGFFQVESELKRGTIIIVVIPRTI
ncbi:MAG: DUF3365 domain-containing protein [Flavobacteriales bacterium]|nr:DUF3365 domain-containing protein [Flavobacteriales bacterium]